ncbi:putative Pre-mRNA-splicing factor SPP2 [Calycina marina]|uniref:Pre-mRNA-splicing factor n=1 Tax=Calycina marina TaxID=1763456 RepID=A0A9P8CBE9_9HELO|nr:putative Pre-mRNA-splicing factor SPP2 [Calycina marina]
MSPSKDGAVPAPKIAVKGFSLSSKSSTSKPGSKPPPPKHTLGKRPRSTFDHDDSESDGERNGRGRHEEVTGFGEGGAIRQEEQTKVEPLIIARQGNNDWRMKKGSKNLLPPEVQAQMRDREKQKNSTEEKGLMNGKDSEPVWGLSMRKREIVTLENGESQIRSTDADVADAETIQVIKPKTADEEALDALLENQERKGPGLVIPLKGGTRSEKEIEDHAYWKAIKEAPEAATLEEYEKVPVEAFGAALLRGMGWKGDVKSTGKKQEVKRRQNLLGLGAKELKDAEELGAWVQKSDVKRLKPASGSDRRPERKPKVDDYRREKERRDERRYERGGGSYRDRDRGRDRDSGRDRDRDRRPHQR